MTFGARNIDRAPDVFTVKSMDWLENMEWHKEELLDVISAHDEEWIIVSDDGKKEAIGMYSCGELVDISDIVDNSNDSHHPERG